jgi:hypothetical protein
LVSAGRDLWAKTTGDWGASDYIASLVKMASIGKKIRLNEEEKKETKEGPMGDVMNPLNLLVEQLTSGPFSIASVFFSAV